MVNRIIASNYHGLNQGHGLKFCVGSQVRREISKEDISAETLWI